MPIDKDTNEKYFYKYSLNESEKLRSDHKKMELFNHRNPAISGELEPLAHARKANEDQEHNDPRPFWTVARDVVAKFKPPAFGLPPLDLYLYGWKQGANIVIAGRPDKSASDLALTLAEHFATNTGPVIWIGMGDDLSDITQRIVLRDAGIKIPETATTIQLNDAEQQALIRAHDRTSKLPIEFCDINQCGDSDLEKAFLVAVTSDKPTLIVVAPSVFDESGLNPFEVVVRRCNLFRMIDQMKKSNQDWRVMWQLPMSDDCADAMLTLANLDEPTVTSSADVVMFAYRQPEFLPADAELVIVRNRFGSTDTLPMKYDPALSTWCERDDALL